MLRTAVIYAHLSNMKYATQVQMRFYTISLILWSIVRNWRVSKVGSMLLYWYNIESRLSPFLSSTVFPFFVFFMWVGMVGLKSFYVGWYGGAEVLLCGLVSWGWSLLLWVGAKPPSAGVVGLKSFSVWVSVDRSLSHCIVNPCY